MHKKSDDILHFYFIIVLLLVYRSINMIDINMSSELKKKCIFTLIYANEYWDVHEYIHLFSLFLVRWFLFFSVLCHLLYFIRFTFFVAILHNLRIFVSFYVNAIQFHLTLGLMFLLCCTPYICDMYARVHMYAGMHLKIIIASYNWMPWMVVPEYPEWVFSEQEKSNFFFQTSHFIFFFNLKKVSKHAFTINLRQKSEMVNVTHQFLLFIYLLLLLYNIQNHILRIYQSQKWIIKIRKILYFKGWINVNK